MSHLKIKKTKIPGCYEILLNVHRDRRGLFVKMFNHSFFRKNKLETNFKEEYYSISKKGVLRGLHFQKYPHAHVKLVHCMRGKIFDAVVDLRRDSKTYGKYAVFELSSEKANMLYIPKGLAHGFYTLSKEAVVLYKVSSEYSPKHDTGILWNSVGIPWPCKRPVLSDRDKKFKEFDGEY